MVSPILAQKAQSMPGMVVCASNPSTQKAEAGGSGLGGQPGPHSEAPEKQEKEQSRSEFTGACTSMQPSGFSEQQATGH
jgi:hypothetical protein